MMPDPGVTITYFRGEDGTYILCHNCCVAMLLEDDIPEFSHGLLAFRHKCRSGLVGNEVVKYVGIKEWT